MTRKKFIRIDFWPPPSYEQLQALQSQLVWSLPKGALISICDQEEKPAIPLSAEETKG